MIIIDKQRDATIYNKKLRLLILKRSRVGITRHFEGQAANKIRIA